jgi:hypothetical protein
MYIYSTNLLKFATRKLKNTFTVRQRDCIVLLYMVGETLSACSLGLSATS